MSTTRSWEHLHSGWITHRIGRFWTSVLDGQTFPYHGAESRMAAFRACAGHVESLLDNQNFEVAK
jgi:hypothetical protein